MHSSAGGPRRAAVAKENPQALIGCGFLRGGDEEIRTPDPLHAKQVLYQLSYIPTGQRRLYGSRLDLSKPMVAPGAVPFIRAQTAGDLPSCRWELPRAAPIPAA
jgi:hypothetical protein